MSSFLFLHADTPWVYTLAGRLAERHVVHAVQFSDWLVYWRQQPSWPENGHADAMRRTMKVLPTGYAGRLAWIARPFVRRTVDGWRAELREESGTEPWVVVCYPYAAPWVRNVPDERLVYYNLDEYTLYRPERAERIRAQETELVERAACTVCLSQYQVDALEERHPDHADRIAHYPLGVRKSFLHPSPEEPPAPNRVVYVGNVGSRVDWALVADVVERCPNLTFTIVGGPIEDSPTADWEHERAHVLRKPNVDHPGRVPQDEVPDYYHSHAVNWIPYDLDHPFNRASCPTKIMDGIASGRPVVSTSVPECWQYPEWITIADDPETTAEVLRARAARRAHDPDRARRQVAFARKHTWKERAQAFENRLGEKKKQAGAST
ncbi:glycosyltransferase [Salinibacter ruber]|uniref:Glycosyltransferase involved in cell wall biosynthesis n=1 Tax=Salinibacter ruber TaxID=146919 RepID=A0A9X2V8C5_9BACT|nr:glycosyltransferase involved in cell wall biosynthesis [Salinibacter ruber]